MNDQLVLSVFPVALNMNAPPTGGAFLIHDHESLARRVGCRSWGRPTVERRGKLGRLAIAGWRVCCGGSRAERRARRGRQACRAPGVRGSTCPTAQRLYPTGSLRLHP